jgi:outer membrane lipoprotein-sorting protein
MILLEADSYPLHPMVKTRFLKGVLSVGALALLCPVGAGQNDSDRARQLILKTLQRNFFQNVIALISQRAPENHQSYQRIQVQISKDGKMRQTIIYPLSMQGVETIDDGRQSATFLPDERLMLIQESPRLLPNDTATRINLTTRNYSLSLDGTSRVAGQNASVVVAKPRHSGLETRRYYIDERTGFLLQLETIEKGGSPKLTFKALQVNYPAKMNPATFEIDVDGKDGRKITYKRRVDLFGGGKAIASIGFEPSLPQDLPFGFEVQDAQINDSGAYGSVAVRITDGLIKATVYQYALSKSKKMKPMPGTTTGESAGIRFVVAADVPEYVRQKLLEAFIGAVRKDEFWAGSHGIFNLSELLPGLPSLTRANAQVLEIRRTSQFLAIPLEK